MVFSNQSLGISAKRPDVFREAARADDFEPSFGQVVGAFVEESFEGVGTLAADRRALQVEAEGTPISQQEWEESDAFRSNIDYYEGMTWQAARVLSDNQDDVDKRAFIMSRAGTASTVAGFTAGFVTGTFEPKNLGLGLATSIVGGQIANRVVGAKRLATAYQKYGKYKSKIAIGGTEGLVAAALAEPSNRESARVLQQDYDMVDSLMNVGLSTALGGILRAGPTYLKDKISRNKGYDVVLDELDTATTQLAEGRQVDVSAVEPLHRAKRRKAEGDTKSVRDSILESFESGAIDKAEMQRLLDFEAENRGLFPDGSPLESTAVLEESIALKKMQLRNIDAEAETDSALRATDAPLMVREGMANRIEEYKSKRAEQRQGLQSKKGRRERIFDEETNQRLSELESELVLFDQLNNISEAKSIASGAVSQKKSRLRSELIKLEKDLASIQERNSQRKITQAVAAANDPVAHTAIDEAELVEYERAAESVEDMPRRIEDEIAEMREAGMLDAEAEKVLRQLDDINPDDIKTGLEAAKICLIRG